uniref:Cytochrome c domain-containing protein n=1 Tax=Panagrellus redivivus TaxID=6233 RepID=A0A7E4VF28_PANRE
MARGKPAQQHRQRQRTKNVQGAEDAALPAADTAGDAARQVQKSTKPKPPTATTQPKPPKSKPLPKKKPTDDNEDADPIVEFELAPPLKPRGFGKRHRQRIACDNLDDGLERDEEGSLLYPDDTVYDPAPDLGWYRVEVSDDCDACHLLPQIRDRGKIVTPLANGEFGISTDKFLRLFRDKQMARPDRKTKTRLIAITKSPHYADIRRELAQEKLRREAAGKKLADLEARFNEIEKQAQGVPAAPIPDDVVPDAEMHSADEALDDTDGTEEDTSDTASVHTALSADSDSDDDPAPPLSPPATRSKRKAAQQASVPKRQRS